MGRRFTSFIRNVFLITTLFTIFYNEQFIYIYQSWSWARLKCKNETNCMRILLVADPQLIGERNEIFHMITPISIWDSDRFLAKTYNAIVKHFKPDVVIFLGDLFDEGSIANRKEYNRYLRRFVNIFTTPYPIKHNIFVPGDNDIGGETDRVTSDKITRFEESFSQPPVITINHITFSKVNRMLIESPKSFDYIDNNNNYNNNKNEEISIVVSHLPLILIPSLFVDKVLEILKPKLIFAAHEHKSKIIKTDKYQQYRKVTDFNGPESQIYQYKLDTEDIYEILVPPCSYRMGTIHVGFGGAVIENDATMEYTVFWSPNRFTSLHIYLFLLSTIAVYISLQLTLK